MNVPRTILGITLAGAMAAISIGDASASEARRQARHGHAYGAYGTYGGGYYRHHYRRYGGNPAIGAAVAGTALGVIGLAAGAAAANRAYDPYGYDTPAYVAPYGYNPGYGEPDDGLF